MTSSSGGDDRKKERHQLPTVPKPLPFDLWLGRIGTASNVVLAIFAVIAFKYTLVPLYRLAATDNALARTELELRTARVHLEETYSKTRGYLIHDFTRNIGLRCTGLMDPPEIPPLAEATRDPGGKEAKELANMVPPWKRMLTLDLTACLTGPLAKSTTLAELRPADREAFEKKWRAQVEQLSEDQRASLARTSSAETDARRDQSLIPPPGP